MPSLRRRSSARRRLPRRYPRPAPAQASRNSPFKHRSPRGSCSDGWNFSLSGDVNGSLLGLTEASGDKTSHSYDGLNRLTEEQTPQGDVTYFYDSANRRTSMHVAGQPAVNYTWDNANRLTQITQGSSTTVGFGYDAANRRTTLSLPNGLSVAYTYDKDSRVTGISYNELFGSMDLTYAYDADGRSTAVGGSLAAVNLPAAVSGNTFTADNEMTGFNGATLGGACCERS
jgi:YD repeat-containing protein